MSEIIGDLAIGLAEAIFRAGVEAAVKKGASILAKNAANLFVNYKWRFKNNTNKQWDEKYCKSN